MKLTIGAGKGKNMKKFKLFHVIIAMAFILGIWGMASAGTLDEISKRGELRIAVQTQDNIKVCAQTVY